MAHHYWTIKTDEWSRDADIETPTHLPRSVGVTYSCSLCQQEVLLEHTAPILQPEWVGMLLDQQRIKEALEVAKQEDPERYQDINEESYITGALSTLNQYLKNVVEDDGMAPRKRIAFRNKKFSVQFGPKFEGMFRYLGFEVEKKGAEPDDCFWLPPVLPRQDGKKTPVDSLRALIENVRCEVQSLLERNPPRMEPVVSPVPAWPSLESALGCDGLQSHQKRPAVDSSEEPEFQLLGAPTNCDDTLLLYAYKRQIETDPARREAYLEALSKLAVRRDLEFQMFVVSQREEQEAQAQQQQVAISACQSPIDRAYAHFNLTRDCEESPTYFISVYQAFREQSPAHNSVHRLALLEIGRDRNNQQILDEVYKTPMETAEACSYLSVELTWPLDTIAAYAQSTAGVSAATVSSSCQPSYSARNGKCNNS